MSHSVLVVEDHDELRVLIQEMLEQRGYDVRCAATMPEAVTTLSEMSCCLILWDPTTLPIDGALLALALSHRVHIATIPVGITANGKSPEGASLIVKRLTSVEALLSVVREHCHGPDVHAVM